MGRKGCVGMDNMKRLIGLILLLISIPCFAVDFTEYNPFTNRLDATCEASRFITYDGTNYEVDFSTHIHIYPGEFHMGASETEMYRTLVDGESTYFYLNSILFETWWEALGGGLLAENGDQLTTEGGDALQWE